MVTSPSYAIYKNSGYGPTFGNGWDIYIANNANSNTNSYANFGSYYSVPSGVQDRKTILAGSYKFTPDEVEVFYLGWSCVVQWSVLSEMSFRSPLVIFFIRFMFLSFNICEVLHHTLVIHVSPELRHGSHLYKFSPFLKTLASNCLFICKMIFFWEFIRLKWSRD